MVELQGKPEMHTMNIILNFPVATFKKVKRHTSGDNVNDSFY